MSAFSWEKYSAALEAIGYKANLKTDASVTVRGYTIQSGNSVYKSSVIGRELTPSRIQETWEKNNGALWTAFLLFANQVDAATTFAQNCGGGGGSAPDPNWGRDKNEDDILWARRCFRKAREMVTTPVIGRGMRR